MLILILILLGIRTSMFDGFEYLTHCILGEVVVAQLAERSLTIPEDPGSNPVIGNFYLNIYLLLTVRRKDENKEKEAENGPFLNTLHLCPV